MFLALIAAALAYPTVVWTIVSCFLALYWLLVAGGALDAEAAGRAEGAPDASADAVTEAGPHQPGVTGAPGVFSRFGLREVPVTVLATIVAALNAVGCHFASQLVPGASFGAATAILAGVFVLSLPLAGVTAWPLRPLFVVRAPPSRAALIGKAAVVSSGRVDDRSGQARVADGPAGLVVDIRAPVEAALRRGERVLLVAWDTTEQAFDVEREDDVLGGSSA